MYSCCGQQEPDSAFQEPEPEAVCLFLLIKKKNNKKTGEGIEGRFLISLYLISILFSFQENFVFFVFFFNFPGPGAKIVLLP